MNLESFVLVHSNVALRQLSRAENYCLHRFPMRKYGWTLFIQGDYADCLDCNKDSYRHLPNYSQQHISMSDFTYLQHHITNILKILTTVFFCNFLMTKLKTTTSKYFHK